MKNAQVHTGNNVNNLFVISTKLVSFCLGHGKFQMFQKFSLRAGNIIVINITRRSVWNDDNVITTTKQMSAAAPREKIRFVIQRTPLRSMEVTDCFYHFEFGARKA